MSRGGAVTMPNAIGQCGSCDGAAFAFNNGQEVAADGTRGYRCNNCGCIKPENWRLRMWEAQRKPIPAANAGWADAHEPAPDPTGSRGLDE